MHPEKPARLWSSSPPITLSSTSGLPREPICPQKQMALARLSTLFILPTTAQTTEPSGCLVQEHRLASAAIVQIQAQGLLLLEHVVNFEHDPWQPKHAGLRSIWSATQMGFANQTTSGMKHSASSPYSR